MHVGVVVLLVGALAGVLAVAASVASPRWRRWLLRFAVLVLGGLVALYAVGLGIAEFWVVDYMNSASYRNDWGGPSLAGVFAVHSGPGLLVLIGVLVWLGRRRRARRAVGSSAARPGKAARWRGRS
jgi:hypothetical protein